MLKTMSLVEIVGLRWETREGEEDARERRKS
jgi:hypothetical protein